MTPAPDSPARSSHPWLVAGVIALCIVVGIVVLGLLLRPTHRERHTADAPLAGRSAATFELLAGAPSVTVRTAGLCNRAIRVTTPDGSRLVPHVTDHQDLVQVDLTDTGNGGSASAVDVVLSSAVTWRIRVVTGATSERLSLASGKVAGVEFVGGASSIDLTLPKPSGEVAVRLTGGAGSWSVHLPAGVPAQVALDSGGSSLSVDGRQRSGLSAGTTDRSDGWDAAHDRYAVTAAAGVASLTLDHP